MGNFLAQSRFGLKLSPLIFKVGVLAMMTDEEVFALLDQVDGKGSPDFDLSWLSGFAEEEQEPLCFDVGPAVAAQKPSPLRPSAGGSGDSELDRILDELTSDKDLTDLLAPPAKKQRLSKRIVPKVRTMRSITPDKDYGWNPEGTMFRGCVGVQVNGEPKYKNWTKDEVKAKLNKMIRCTWKWTDEKRSDCNLSRWLLKVLETYGSDEFNPRDIEIFKLVHTKKGRGSRKNSVPGTIKYYPPYDALCSGYEISCCPFVVTKDASHTKMRLSPVFVECLKENRLL